MRKLLLSVALVSALLSTSVVANDRYSYDRYDGGHDHRSGGRVIVLDPVQQMQIRQQQERMYRLQEDTAVRQGLKDAWRVDGESSSRYRN